MKKRIAYCGLDCEACDARRATVTNDNDLREKTAKLWSELNNAPITADMIHCMGCRADGVKTPFCESICAIRICAQEKGFATCGACPSFEAYETLKAITNGNPDALTRLKAQ